MEFSINLELLGRRPDSGRVSVPEPSAGRVRCEEFRETMLMVLPGAIDLEEYGCIFPLSGRQKREEEI